MGVLGPRQRAWQEIVKKGNSKQSSASTPPTPPLPPTPCLKGQILRTRVVELGKQWLGEGGGKQGYSASFNRPCVSSSVNCLRCQLPYHAPPTHAEKCLLWNSRASGMPQVFFLGSCLPWDSGLWLWNGILGSQNFLHPLFYLRYNWHKTFY